MKTHPAPPVVRKMQMRTPSHHASPGTAQRDRLRACRGGPGGARGRCPAVTGCRGAGPPGKVLGSIKPWEPAVRCCPIPGVDARALLSPGTRECPVPSFTGSKTFPRTWKQPVHLSAETEACAGAERSRQTLQHTHDLGWRQPPAHPAGPHGHRCQGQDRAEGAPSRARHALRGRETCRAHS